MDPIENKAFWDTVGANGPVPYDELAERVAEVLDDHPDWARLPDADTTVLYSGRIGPDGAGSATGVAQDMASRSHGTLGIIDDTPAGRALGEMTASLDNATIEQKFAGIIDFSDAPMTSAEWSVRANSPDPSVKAGAWEFSGDLYNTFKPSSEAFASQLSGRVITVTPDAEIGRDFRQVEVPSLVDRIESGHVTHVNGVPAEEITKGLNGLSGEAKLDAAFERFNQDFTTNMRTQGLDVHVGERVVDGRTVDASVLDVDQSHLDDLGGSPGARINDPNLDGLRALNSPTPERGVGAEPENAPDRTSVQSLDDVNAELRAADADGHLMGFAADPEAKTSHLLNTETGRIYELTEGQVSKVTAFDDVGDAHRAMGDLQIDAARRFPGTFKGVPDLHPSLGSLGNHIDDLARPPWRKMLGAAGDTVGDLAGKGSKILGPLGVAAAGYEVYSLETKLHDLAELHDIPEAAMLEYHVNMTAHAAQATVDPSLLGGEVLVQANHDRWGAKYNLDPEIIEALEPGSLLEDIDAAKDWLGDRAAEAGMAVQDYTIDRYNNPEKIGEDFERIGDNIADGAYYVAEKAEAAAEVTGEYISSRYNDPSRLLDDAEAVGDAVYDNAASAGRAIRDTWNEFWEEDTPNALEQNLRSDGAEGIEIPVERVMRQINHDYAPAQDEIGARADQASLDLDTARLGKMLSQTGTSALYPSLQTAGVETVTLPPHDYTQSLERVDAALRAGVNEMQAHDLPTPPSEYIPEADRTGISNEVYAEAASQGSERGTEMIQQALRESHAARDAQQQQAELNESAEYDASL